MKAPLYIDPSDVMVAGKSAPYWAQIGSILDAYGIDCPSKLVEKLNPKKTESRVDIYDAINMDRLLGSVPKPEWRGGYSLRVATYPGRATVSARPWDDPTLSLKTIDFTASIKRSGPLDVEAILTTHDRLNDLMAIRDFRLPGESHAEAERRRWL